MSLDEIRKKIDDTDKALIDSYIRRCELVEEIAEYKRINNIPIMDNNREAQLLKAVTELAGEKYSADIEKIFSLILDLSKNRQRKHTEGSIFGLLGENLSHSFSPQIHKQLCDYSYLLFSMPKNQIESFLKSKKFNGINVTIPYKETVIKFCDELSETASRLKSVNTITVNSNRLIGHNTDYYGFFYLLRKNKVDVSGKKCLVLGSGGASKTVCAVLEDLQADATVISRTGKNNYENISKHFDAEIIINTTPVGMYPNNGKAVIDISLFKNCTTAIDLIYNPSKTELLLNAEALSIKAVNGLDMLVAQAKKSCELFTGKNLSEDVIETIKISIEKNEKNIILIGMPSCGKTSVGRLLSKKLNRKFIDTDYEIEKLENKKISEIFSQNGENYFRKIETQILKNSSKESATVIATGGGVVTVEENINLLKQHSVIVFLDRKIDNLTGENRPLSKNKEAIKKLYDERIDLYKSLADITVDCNSGIEVAVEAIYENICN